jgi:hypothetical protein
LRERATGHQQCVEKFPHWRQSATATGESVDQGAFGNGEPVRARYLVAQSPLHPDPRFQVRGRSALDGPQGEPWEILYFEMYRSQLPVIERALETAALLLGTKKSRGYCPEMICAYFLAGASLDAGEEQPYLWHSTDSSARSSSNSDSVCWTR